MIPMARGALSVLLLAFAAPLASAQDRMVLLGVSGGIGIPVGDLGNAVGTGFGVAGHLGLRFPLLPFSLRGDLGYDRFSESDGGDGHVAVASGTINAKFASPAGVGIVRPYFIAGVGAGKAQMHACRAAAPAGFCQAASTGLAFGGGGGIDFGFGGLNGFAELRYRRVATDGSAVTWIPVTVGVAF